MTDVIDQLAQILMNLMQLSYNVENGLRLNPAAIPNLV
jgi:hypothetical protein